jgi:hypothetical protein
MTRSVTQQRLSFGSQPVVLVGDPRRCMGVLAIHNPNDHPVKLRRIQLRSASGKLSNSCDPEMIEIRLLASLCPCETRQVEVSVPLPPFTPPGCYEASLEGADGASCRVSIHVLERRRLRLSPASLSYTKAPGETFALCVTATNLGNVPVEVPRSAALALHDREHGWHDHFHAAASTHGDQGNGPFLDAFIKRMAAAEPPVGRIRISEGAGVLAPDSSRLLEIAVSLPKKLRAPYNYAAVAYLADAALSLNLLVTQPSDPNHSVES